jgi:hypothetical protein
LERPEPVEGRNIWFKTKIDLMDVTGDAIEENYRGGLGDSVTDDPQFRSLVAEIEDSKEAPVHGKKLVLGEC